MTATTVGAIVNLATEDIVHLLNELGVETGIATENIVAAAWDVAKLIEISPRSHVTASGTRAKVMAEARTHGRSHPPDAERTRRNAKNRSVDRVPCVSPRTGLAHAS